MFRASYAKKALAILMTLALLASCLADCRHIAGDSDRRTNHG